MYPTVLVYHKVDDRVEWGLTRVTPQTFRNQIRILKEDGYRFLTTSEIRNCQPEDKVVAINFDDAYESVYEYAYPILKDEDVPATIYVISDYVGELNSWDLNVGNLQFPHATWEQLKVLRDAGWEIGSHTKSHMDLRSLNDDDLKKELRESKELLESKLEINVKSLSFPFGRANNREIGAAIEAGYENGTIFYPIFNQFNAEYEEFIIRRLGLYLWDTKFFFRAKYGGQPLKGFEILKQNVLNTFAGITIAAQNSSNK